ncbi:MAG: YncE family protein [Bacteroidetes bacterium]|nr:YncE family protein [Bacteroidota bacterium]
MKHISSLLLAILTFMFLFPACDGDNSVAPPIVPEGPRGLYILNEGNFQRGNASLSFYIPDSNLVFNDQFQFVNGRPLGDVGNSITLHEGNAYLVINNSHKIEVMNVNTQKSVTTIVSPDGASPREIAFASNGLGFISNLYDNTVSIYNPADGLLEGSIAVGNNPDGIAAVGNRVIVANSGFGSGNTVSIIDAENRDVIKNVRVGDYPTAVLPLSPTAVAVLCTGDYGDFNNPDDDTPGGVYIVDVQTRTVVDSLVLGGHPTRLARDADGFLYTLQASGVTRIHLSSKGFTENFIPGFFYNIFVDTVDGKIYLTNPVDYVQAGKLEVYTLDGTREATFDVGVIPNAMVMNR